MGFPMVVSSMEGCAVCEPSVNHCPHSAVITVPNSATILNSADQEIFSARMINCSHVELQGLHLQGIFSLVKI